ncbi:hypothetical protein [Desulfobacula sp.]|uniref:hypothetical protein n=1 Tax=Desulfobacula sp. TaxID=2593537 RepID=UPI002602AE8F|nr:hypothetical protein [Desulfobacula sp.]
MVLYADKFNKIIKFFKKNNIAIDKPGFFNDPNFLKFEQKNPRFLNCYARYVYGRKYDREYLIEAEDKILKACEIMHSELLKDGRKGACIDLSIVLAQILDKLGVWNFVVKGALTMEFPTEPNIGNQYFWPMDVNDSMAGHVWIYAPPFTVIDLTIHEQPYEKYIENYIPDKIFLKKTTLVDFTINDICSPEFRHYMEMNRMPLSFKGIDMVNPELKHFFKIFKTSSFQKRELSLKYIPCAVSGSEAPLERVTSLNLSGKTGYEVYKELIEPIFI